MATSEDNAALFAIYIALYVNDTACNCIYDIKPYVAGKDKETRKIYGALNKRADHYFEHVRKVVSLKNRYFLAEFNQVIDECCDQSTEMLVRSVRGCLREHNIEDDGLICKTIVAQVLTEFALNTVTAMSNKLKEDNSKMRGLDGWKLRDIQRVMTNFYLWVCRKVPDEVIMDMQKLIDTITTLYANSVTNYQNFEKAYHAAIKREKEIEND